MKSLSLVRLFGTPWTVAYDAPPSMGFPRQEYWNGLSIPSPVDLLDPGMELGSPALQADSLPTEISGMILYLVNQIFSGQKLLPSCQVDKLEQLY